MDRYEFGWTFNVYLIRVWTLRKKIPNQKGFWWLTGLKSKKQCLAAISPQWPLRQTALQGESCGELVNYQPLH